MAYDPNDPADKKLVEAMIKKAVDEALSEATTEHEASTAGLKKKNKELLEKLAKGDGADPREIERLEGEVEKLSAKVRDTEKALKTATRNAEEAARNYEAESGFARNLLVENGLTAALVENKVAAQFLPAVKALLSSQVAIKTEGNERKAFVGDKPLGDFVKEWSQGDGKHYVAAPNNGGGGAPGGQANGGGKTMTRTAYDAGIADGSINPGSFFKEGGSLIEG